MKDKIIRKGVFQKPGIVNQEEQYGVVGTYLDIKEDIHLLAGEVPLLKNMIKDGEAQIDQEEQPVQRIENVIRKLIMIGEVDYDQSY